jgi:hypothetical protein
LAVTNPDCEVGGALAEGEFVGAGGGEDTGVAAAVGPGVGTGVSTAEGVDVVVAVGAVISVGDAGAEGRAVGTDRRTASTGRFVPDSLEE